MPRNNSPLPQYPRHFLQRSAHAQQLVFAEDDQAFIVRVVGGADAIPSCADTNRGRVFGALEAAR